MAPGRRHDAAAIDRFRDAYAHNKAFWDEVTPIHAASDYYRLDQFRRGEDVLHDFIVEEVGDVSGLSMLHLQCHFGLDTLNWARKGAEVTGVDISGASIERARELSTDLNIPASFVQANVLKMGDRFDAAFDRVFTSIGALCWIGDLEKWGRAIARALKPGGVFYIAEFHPVMDTLQQSMPITESSAAYPGYPYFGDGIPLRFDPEGDDSDYAEASFTSEETTFEWFHPISEVIGALIDAGLVLERFLEHPFVTYKARQGMVQSEDGLWRLPPGVVPLPLMFSITTAKPNA
ncbi:MAG TPA: class I SAM-dependent methyltransferase [Dehalococcoidia bacterium]|jgi:SAM-dependent methyltransferase|nr:SAM-dependent methyltransferase [Chloroflexota bacterium]MDP5877429.1 class I SAM-dependent methyltransferase [Dehalococcoidia bacterium]MDP7213075.1 class I SAM-dependent methyltransferase [Dehalococcoidia bacterium]HCV27011.1 SAM-dependent methyltransferase [Dehalococcoidia bacterium]HJM52818.1 class I SAM-dependent methyltransferase [Dehalococcoidia bacterium]|tara:strand:+ start:1591 stop:2463 length:873 start_codon:yes stop_codon:yes gene_type:complete